MAAMDTNQMLERLAEDLANAVPTVDDQASHSRWQAGLGPFEEDRQIEMLKDAIEGDVDYSIETEVPYLEGGRRVDLVVDSQEVRMPIEAKLIRFRFDNGNIDPNSFAKVFSPFPERTTSTLLTDALKIGESKFEENGGLLGLYYEPEDEPYARMSATMIAEKLCLDVKFWYDFEIETRNIAHFKGLRHPVHQQGAIITWEVTDST